MGLAVFGGAAGTKGARRLAFVGGCTICAMSLVLGCGGGSSGGGGGGPVATTTTLSSSSLRIQYQQPLTLIVHVVASNNPAGNVQLSDNGQAYGASVAVI